MSKLIGHRLIKERKDKDDFLKLLTIEGNRKKRNKEGGMERRRKIKETLKKGKEYKEKKRREKRERGKIKGKGKKGKRERGKIKG